MPGRLLGLFEPAVRLVSDEAPPPSVDQDLGIGQAEEDFTIEQLMAQFALKLWQ